MKYTQIKFVAATAIRAMFNPTVPGSEHRADGATTLLCQGESQENVNEYLADGWELIQFITHHSAEKDATAVVAVLGKPYGYNDTSIDTLDLPVRANNVLKVEGVWTIGALISRTEMDLLKMPNMGRRTLNMVKEALGERSLALRCSS